MRDHVVPVVDSSESAFSPCCANQQEVVLHARSHQEQLQAPETRN